MLKKVNVSNWIELDMIGYNYFVIYAEAANEWWLLTKADTLEEAKAQLKEQAADGEEGLMIINIEGKRVKEC